MNGEASPTVVRQHTMRFRAAISTNADTTTAVEEAVQSLGGLEPDVLMVFASHHHGPEFSAMVEMIRERTNPRNLVGCTGEGIIGPDTEVEGAPAIALWAAKLPGVRSLPFYVDQEDVEAFDGSDDWRERVGLQATDSANLILLPDPFSIDVTACLDHLDNAFEGATIVGGVVSGGRKPGQNRMFLNDQVLRRGMVGISLCGPLLIKAAVSQGCRPVGKSYVVTRSDENVIVELGGRPAMHALQEVFQSADPKDRALMEKGLHIGRLVDERIQRHKPGDFLIHNLMGVREETALVVNALVRIGQTVQFHVRDSQTASEEMKTLVGARVSELGGAPAGGLLFSCNGRGRRMFGRPHHDIGVVNELAQQCQVAGFFAAGEIGPVGHRTFVHGFTSSLILFSEAPARPAAGAAE